MVVVPEQRRTLVHGVVKDRWLAGSKQVLSPPVKRCRGETTVQMHHRVAGKRARTWVGRAAAQARQALHRDVVTVGVLGSNRLYHRQRAFEFVAPLDHDRFSALGLDRRPGDRPVVAPDPRLGQVTVEAMRRGPDPHRELTLVLRRNQSPRHKESVNEWSQWRS